MQQTQAVPIQKKNLQTPQQNRAHVLPHQGCEAHRYKIRQARQQFPQFRMPDGSSLLLVKLSLNPRLLNKPL
jgi:hypothetical protein